MNRTILQAEATTITGLAVFVGVTVALVLGKIGLDAWLAVSASAGVLIGIPQRPAPPTTQNSIAADVAVVAPPAQPVPPEKH
ncbi:hypothetical protein NFI95_15450 [Acetobacteraceae bacterium KSS8]|uniref:Holin n=1 Tax=Endosaccharibacter trunci TaxID=2812733 RepID=A0ABT1WAC3_9PROT|nr:hypothetical protein [Acetobacteraceae bacterium KSS8]